MSRIKDLDHLLVEALRAAEMRQGCTNHTYYAEILRKQICQLFPQPLDDKGASISSPEATTDEKLRKKLYDLLREADKFDHLMFCCDCKKCKEDQTNILDQILALLPDIVAARKEGFDDGVSKTTIAMDSTIDAQLGEARSQGIRMAIDNLKMHHCIVDVPARIKEIEEQALSGKGAGE